MLTLYSHPLASFCHKVLIALYENGTPFAAQTIDFAAPADAAMLETSWPIGKIPVLRDGERVVPETTIILDYLDAHYPGPVRLLPADPDQRREALLWDRFFDLYVSVPMQKIVTDRLRPAGAADPHGVGEARATLDVAYGMIERQLGGRDWAAGEVFGIADCAAAPGLFFASIVHPFAPEQVRLAAYFERLLARPSFARVLDEAKPWFRYFPLSRRHAGPLSCRLNPEPEPCPNRSRSTACFTRWPTRRGGRCSTG